MNYEVIAVGREAVFDSLIVGQWTALKISQFCCLKTYFPSVKVVHRRRQFFGLSMQSGQ